ncbi:MAG: hypothetical protein HOH04_17055 [Rhodospirillaceae bacterium]|jgi:hypothetical protein|nr:hypothetical protein [Rhodospirillaceae bacterium]
MEDRRAHLRTPSPRLKIRADGSLFDTLEWSQGNLVIAAAGAFRVGALVTIDGLGTANDDIESVGIRGRVTRVTEGGDAAVDFLHRDDNAMWTLRRLAGG